MAASSPNESLAKSTQEKLMSHTPQPQGDRPLGSPEVARVVGAVVGLSALLILLVVAFAWPASNTGPRDVPVAVVGPAHVTTAVADRVAREHPGAFEIAVAPDRDAAVRMIEGREVYGAIVASPEGLEVLTASAASPAVEQLLAGLAAAIGTAGGAPVTVTDVVSTTVDDPRGAGLAAGALPLVIVGIATAAVLSSRVRKLGLKLAGVVGVGIIGGLAMAAVLQFWLGSLDGSFWANSGVLALGIAAIATTLIGLARLLGFGGLALGAAVMVMLGNPLSGLASAPELLPSGWGTVGQLLPPGALGTALRSVAFFDGAGSGWSFVVLVSWVGLGVALCLPDAMKQRQPDGARDGAASRPGRSDRSRRPSVQVSIATDVVEPAGDLRGRPPTG